MLKDPEKRFSSVSQMLAGLELGETTSIVDSRPIPDVRVPVTVVDDEPLYITDDEEDDEGDMFFGPVQEVFSEATTPETSIGAFPSEPAAACTRGRPSSAAISEEPIARAVKKGASKAKQWWRDSNLSNPVKFLLLLAGVIVLVFNSEILVPLSLTFVAAYLIYLGIRWIVIGMNRSGERREAQPLVRRYGDWKQRARLAVHHKSPAEKASDLTGAMLLSAIISMSLCFVLLLLNGISFETVPGWSSFTWLSLTAVAGVWTLLAAGKFWERTDGEGVRRRFLMLIAGLAIGALAYSTSRLLLVPQNYLTVDLRDSLASPGMYDNQIPSLAAYLCFFAGLFFLVRWWKQVDPLRNSRLSVWATAMSVVWALVLHTFIPFPHPWILPLVISVSAQLSAPWVNEKEKKQFRQSVQEVV